VAACGRMPELVERGDPRLRCVNPVPSPSPVAA
jgi:hypothetical protein